MADQVTRAQFDAQLDAMSFQLLLEEEGGVRFLRLVKTCHECGGHQHIPMPRIEEDCQNPEVLGFVLREIRARDCGHGKAP